MRKVIIEFKTDLSTPKISELLNKLEPELKKVSNGNYVDWTVKKA